MTHKQLAYQVFKVKYSYEDLENLSYEEIEMMSDSDLITYLEQEEEFNYRLQSMNLI